MRLCSLVSLEMVYSINTYRSSMTYYQAKRSCALFAAARVALKGPEGPFAGWVFSGEQWESFNSEGEVDPLYSSLERVS